MIASAPDEPGELRLRARLFCNGCPRAARADREALEQARGDVRGADPDHLLAPVDVLTGPLGERRCRRDRVGQCDKRDACCAAEQEREVGEADAGERQRWESLRQRPDETDPVLVEVEQVRREDREDDRDEDRGDLRQQPLQDEDHHEAERSDRKRGGHRLAVGDTVDEPPQLGDEAVGVDGEPEQLRQLPDQDRHREAVHVADHRRLRQQVGDEAELGDAAEHHDGADEEREHRGERDRPRRVAVGGRSGAGSSRRSSARATSPGRGRGSSTARRPRNRAGRGSTCRGR